jgi:hypothetical protein
MKTFPSTVCAMNWCSANVRISRYIISAKKKFCRSVYQNETLVVVMEAAVGVGSMPMVVKDISTKEVRKR